MGGGFVAILCIRLQVVFKDAANDVKYTGFNRITFAVIFIVLVGHTLNAVLFLTESLSVEGMALIVTALIVIVLIYSAVLATIFVRRLFRMVQAGKFADEAVLTSSMTKMTLIALVSIMGSIIMIIGTGIAAATPMTLVDYVLISLGSMLDVMVDAVCISLSMNMHSEAYDRICYSCDSKLKKCCFKWADRTSAKQETELAHTNYREQQSGSVESPKMPEPDALEKQVSDSMAKLP